MANNISEGAAAAKRRAARERFQQTPYPGQQIFQDPAAPGKTFEDMAAPLPGTSTGLGEFTPPKKKSNWKKGLGAALQGAAYAIQADIGPAVPGEEFRQGIMRGVVGTGMASAARSRAAALAEGREEGLSGKLALLEARRAGKMDEAEKLRITEAGKDRRLAATKVSKEESDRIRAGISENDQAKIALEIQKDIAKRPSWAPPLSERQYWDEFERRAKFIPQAAKRPPAPKEVVPEFTLE